MTCRRPWLLLLCLLCGCGGSDNVPEDESQSVTTYLTTALEAWKEKQLPGLQQKNPAIRFTDDDMTEGIQLTSYELIEAPQRSAAGITEVRVKLTLKASDGAAVERTALYQITQENVVSIHRVE